jgi:hypothetical protein
MKLQALESTEQFHKTDVKTYNNVLQKILYLHLSAEDFTHDTRCFCGKASECVAHGTYI